jgi:acyl carrier protein
MSETADRVKKIVVEHLGVEADKVTEEAAFIDDAAEKIGTVKDAIDFIDKNKG